ncbi:MAG: excinuclease ABC subunit UvrC [Epsilonproteobacteria bacterium]|nr:excinuclease ABC subunit UvrC [Campylobacterota bacterium]
MTLEEKLQNLPSNAGVYQYFDKNNRLLYIGKAKNLKNRVKSYFQFTPVLAPSSQLSYRISKMISEVANLEYIIVPNENDALILENSLIKQLKPKFNILLRDDKTYPYIYIDTTETFPRLEITRKVLKGKGIKYFGPFSTGARDMLDSIYEILPLVQKKSCIKSGKACLFYQINKCLAPCEGRVTIEEYQKIIDKALYYIYNKTKLVEDIKIKMEQLSMDFRFEEAMVLRDRIKTIEKSELKSTLDFANFENIDLFSVQLDAFRGVVVKMFIRDGKLISASHNFINTTEITELEDVYKTAIVNYYANEIPTVPNEIILPIELENSEELENFIVSRFGKKIALTSPKIGKKKELTLMALRNCEELLKIDNSYTKKDIYISIKELFRLYKLSHRFECFDNSHIMGQATVGSMVVWDNDEFIKDDYRLYNLSSKDEYGQMKEMLSRRVERFKENPPPDVWIIDGGKTLLTLAYDILESVGVSIDVIGIAKEKIDAKANRAKGGARDILYTKDEVFRLEPSDKRLQFIQRLRDEVHRTAIGFHKKQKRKEDKQISLLSIKGISEAKVKKLVSYFGTFEAIRNVNKEQLQEVLNEKDANILFQYFKSKE